MASSRESFSIGDIQCVAISDGTFSYPVEWIFSNAPKEQLEDSLRNHDLPMNQVVTPYTCLLVKAGKQRESSSTQTDSRRSRCPVRDVKNRVEFLDIRSQSEWHGDE